jgi:hypothetical protein
VFSPNSNPEGGVTASRATRHNDFDDDGATLKATLARITGVQIAPAGVAAPEFQFHPSSSSLRGKREAIDLNSRSVGA